MKHTTADADTADEHHLITIIILSYYIWRVQSSQIPLCCFLLDTLNNTFSTCFWQKLLPTDTFWFVAVPQPTSFQINSSFCLPTLNCFLSSLPLATSYFRFLHPWQPPGNMATWQHGNHLVFVKTSFSMPASPLTTRIVGSILLINIPLPRASIMTLKLY